MSRHPDMGITPPRLSRALKLTRLYHRLSQSDLADRLAISKSHLSEIESGKKSPSLELLQRYASEFDIPASTLLLFAERLDSKLHARDKARVEKVMRILEWVADTGDDA